MTYPNTLPAISAEEYKEVKAFLRSLTRKVIGAEPRGFHSRVDAIDTISGTGLTVDGVPVNEIWNDLLAMVAAVNGTVASVEAALTQRITRPTDKAAVYTTAKFEQATEYGRPSKVQMQYIARGYPLEHYDLGLGYTQEYLDDAPSGEIRAAFPVVRAAYIARRFDLVLESVLFENNLTDKDGVAVKRLYNADGEIPPVYKRTTHDGTHTHYLTSGGASFTDANIVTIEDHLLHHGFGDFGESFVLMVPRANMTTIRGLTDYVKASESPIPEVRDGVVVGRTASAPAGFAVDGYIHRFAVVETLDIPDDYLMAFATGGALASTNVVGMRDHENASARGLRLIEGPRQRYPLYDSVYDFYAGAGVKQRGAAVVMQATAGAYTDPAL